jgi:hypothetical protein
VLDFNLIARELAEPPSLNLHFCLFRCGFLSLSFFSLLPNHKPVTKGQITSGLTFFFFISVVFGLPLHPPLRSPSGSFLCFCRWLSPSTFAVQLPGGL